MVRIPDPLIEQVRQAHDIVEVVGRTVRLQQLEPRSKGLRYEGFRYKGLCPFHAEQVPSFFLNPDRQTCECFSCRAFENSQSGVSQSGIPLTGDVFHFTMLTQGLGFSEAVRQLAAERGIHIPEEPPEGDAFGVGRDGR